MASTPKGAATRRRILDAAWQLSDAHGVELVLGGVTLREIAAAVDMTPSAVSYHFPTMDALAMAMVEHLAADVSPLPVAAVDELLDGAGDAGLGGAARAAASANWAVLTTPSEVTYERRFLRALAAAQDGPVLGAVGALQEAWVEDLTLVYRRTAERLQLRTIDPFDVREIALCIAAMADGLLHHWMCDPASVRPDLMADVVVALASATIVPAEHDVDLAERSAGLGPAAPSRSTADRHADVELAAQAAALFSSGVDEVTLTRAARVLGTGTDELATRFGTVERIAALCFGRHLGAVADAIGRRPDTGPAVSLTDGVYELARCALADPHCALALLQECQRECLAEADSDRVSVRSLVPFDGLLQVPLSAVLDGASAPTVDVAALVVDTVLGLASGHRRLPPALVTETALRLVPAEF